MVLKSNRGRLPANEVVMTNILSFLLVKNEYEISYEGEDFIIHRAAKGHLDMMF